MKYMGKYQKAYIKHYKFCLLIFLTIFNKFIFTLVKRKIADSAKTGIEVLFIHSFIHSKNK